ncbi:hypothetical protein GCM10022198_23250 [Klugiella xanthotipulae]|uniref:LPXTG-motif cell wall-anchored protein n=1 Tax=Klugiella xanthotipulae TaxID=244735 RepID=A0A543I5T9_9MICO|nr:hypothetical protein [Klugiella xanthotipulae]TQM65948.1 hypothetical protein FB466_0768 [Klugiella xanthotipulae]
MTRMPSLPRWARALTVGSAILVVAVLGLAGPALATPSGPAATTTSAAADPLLLSNDGVTWAAQLAHPLFDADYRYVPGERVTSGFWLKNNSGHNAYYTVQVTGVEIPADLTGALSLSVGSNTESAKNPVILANCAVAVRNVKLAAGSRVYLPSTVTMSSTAPLAARNQTASFGVTTTLHDAPLDLSDGQCLTSEGIVPAVEPTLPHDPTLTPGETTAGTSTGTPGDQATAPTAGGASGALALTGVYLGGWVTLSVLLSAGGILLASRRRRAEDR